MVLVPMIRAVEPRDTSVSPMDVPDALRVRVASPKTTCVGMMVTVTAPGAAETPGASQSLGLKEA